MFNKMKPAIWVAFTCLIIRIAYLGVLDRLPPQGPYDGYVEIAENILAGKGFSPTPLHQFFLRTPTYPLFIAGVWSVGPTELRYLSLALVQVCLSVGTCVLIYALADELFGRKSALAAGMLFALSPSYTILCSLVYTETLQLMLVCLAAFSALRLYQSGRPWSATCLGLLCGIMGLNRPESTFLIPILGLPYILSGRYPLRKRAQNVLIIVLANVLVMSPWVARNYRVFGTFVVHVPVGGLGLFGGTYPRPPLYGDGWKHQGPRLLHISTTDEYQEITKPFWDPRYLQRSVGKITHVAVVREEKDFVELDRRLGQAAKNNIRNYKLIQIRNVIAHLKALWGRPAAWTSDLAPSLKLVWFGAYLAFQSLFVLGILTAWKSGRLDAIPLSWLILMTCHTGLLLLFCAEPRYQATSAIFLYIFGGLGVASILPFPALRSAGRGGPSAVAAEGPGRDPDEKLWDGDREELRNGEATSLGAPGRSRKEDSGT